MVLVVVNTETEHQVALLMSKTQASYTLQLNEMFNDEGQGYFWVMTITSDQ